MPALGPLAVTGATIDGMYSVATALDLIGPAEEVD